MDSKGKKDESLAIHASDAEPNGGSCESEPRYQQLVEMMNEGLARADGSYVFSYVNQRFADMLGYAPEEMIGHSLLDFVHPDNLEFIMDQIARRKRGEAGRFETAWASKDGAKVYTLVSPRPVFDDEGNFAGSVAVLTDITDRKLAEQALEDRLEFEALIMNISTQFINLPSDQVDEGILKALRTIGEFAGIDRAYVFQIYDDGAIMDNTHEWCAEGIESHIQRLKGLKVDSFPWSAEKMRKLETVHVPLVSDLPAEAAAEKREWQLEGIQTLIFVPMVYRESLVGFVGFDAVRERMTWSDDSIALLKLVGYIFVSALERKRVEEALKESEERYRSLVEFSPDMVTMTVDGKIAYANPAAAKLVGAEKPEDLVGRSPLDLIHPKDRDNVKERMRLMTEEGKTVPIIEEQFLRMDGTWVDVEVAAMPVVYKGKPSILAVMRDITERKRAEEALKASEAELRALFSAMTDVILVLNSEGRYLEIAPTNPSLLYRPANEILGKTLYEVFPKEEADYFLEVIHRALKEQKTVQTEYELKIGDRELWFSASVSPMLEDTVIWVARDITERKRAEEALQRSEANFQAIFDYMPGAIFGFDRDGVIVQANEACERLFGFSREELLGGSLYETISSPKDHKRRRSVIARVFEGEIIEGLEWQDRKADGSTVYVLSNATPVFDKSGQIIMALSLSIDITERKLAEQRRRELEVHKRDFYRRTIQAATEGKLLITEKEDIERIAGPPIASWEIRRGEDLGAIRQAVRALGEKAGMDPDRLYDFILTVGESTTNAYKHAGGGMASLHNTPDGLIFVVSDNGPGIEALTLPEVALVRGYSTAGTLGMGYKAILSIADKVYLATGPRGTTVAIALRLHPAPKPVEAALLPDTWTS
ncbi:MAG TPA: PAS domain S-box protein [Armatimonadota bacterium]|nr:PAS domain S-box protein [Armatimonadota bacterium]